MNKGKRKMLMVLALLAIPILVISFWFFGTGSKVAKDKDAGLNPELPAANLTDNKVTDKLGFYLKADKDSVKFREWMRSDPYYRKKFSDEFPAAMTEDPPGHEDRLMAKVKMLQDRIYEPEVKMATVQSVVPGLMMPEVEQPVEEDPEIRQLEGALDKILDIQHPERVKIRLRASTPRKDILLVSTQSSADTIATGFFSTQVKTSNEEQDAIRVVVHENQSVVNGSIIKLRLMQDAYINQVRIPKGHFIYGVAKLEGERLKMEIHSIRKESSLYNVKLNVYDMDGMEGIHIPGAITRSVAKQSADNSLQFMGMGMTDGTLMTQAANLGIGAAKNLFSKKAKLVKVGLKAGYKLLIKQI